MQRFKSVEEAGLENSWALSSRLELVPDKGFGCISMEERALAGTRALREAKLKALLSGKGRG